MTQHRLSPSHRPQAPMPATNRSSNRCANRPSNRLTPCPIHPPAAQRSAGPATRRPRPVAQAAALASLLLLGACNDDGAETSSAPTPTPPATVSQTVKVIDGAIRGAVVCLDKNNNGACDSGEPGGTTAADGTVSFTVDAADANKHPVLALVGTDAVDADHGPVTVAYSLSAPADQPAVVSPLSTLVVAQAAGSGQSTAEAALAVQQALGLSSNALADFTLPGAERAAGDAARLLVLAAQQQLSATADARASDGSVLAKADLARAVQTTLLNNLPALANALATSGLTPASSATERAAALGAAATGFATTQGLNASNAGAVVAMAKIPTTPESSNTPAAAGLTLRWFEYSDAGNYFFRQFKSTAEQNTVVNGKRRFTEYREQSRSSNGVNTAYMQWGEGLNNLARNLRYWNGSAWFDCPTEHVHEATAWDAQGRSSSAYCGVFSSSNQRRARDISGLKMVDVVKEIRAFPLKDGTLNYANWGPDPSTHAAALAGNFPAGSLLYHYTGTDTNAVDQHGTALGDAYMPYVAAVAAGSSNECNQVTPSNSWLWQETNTTSLDTLIARNTGTPCVYSPRSTSTGTVPNEWWGASTVTVGDYPVVYNDPDGYFRSHVRQLRASFVSGGSTVRYWSCLRRANDGSPRNCSSLGTGSYRIDTLGNSRVLRFNGLPAEAASMLFDRTFVEIGGQVWHGSRSRPQVSAQQRLNLQATQALFTALGIPAPRSGAPLTADSLLRDYTSHAARVNTGGIGWVNRGALGFMAQQANGVVGAWTLSATGSPRAQTFWFFEDGRYVMADPMGDTGPNRCGPSGYEVGTYRYEGGRLSITGISLDTNLCAGLHDSTDGSRFDAALSLSADGQRAVVTHREGTDTLYRLRP